MAVMAAATIVKMTLKFGLESQPDPPIAAGKFQWQSIRRKNVLSSEPPKKTPSHSPAVSGCAALFPKSKPCQPAIAVSAPIKLIAIAAATKSSAGANRATAPVTIAASAAKAKMEANILAVLALCIRWVRQLEPSQNFRLMQSD